MHKGKLIESLLTLLMDVHIELQHTDLFGPTLSETLLAIQQSALASLCLLRTICQNYETKYPLSHGFDGDGNGPESFDAYLNGCVTDLPVFKHIVRDVLK